MSTQEFAQQMIAPCSSFVASTLLDGVRRDYKRLRCHRSHSERVHTAVTEITVKMTRCSAIAERSCCRVRQFWPKVADWNWETIFYGHYRSIFNHCDIIGIQSYRIRCKTQNKGYYAVQGHSRSSRVGTNRKPLCD